MLHSKGFFQVGFVVCDIREAMATWIGSGVGPFYFFPHIDVPNGYYRGQPQKFDISAAVAQAGALQIELIEHHGDGPSPYRDVYSVGQSGLHHMGAYAKDFDASILEFKQQGLLPVFEGNYGARVAYFDTRSTLGFMTEILEPTETIVGIFKRVADEAVGWDGQDPIRRP